MMTAIRPKAFRARLATLLLGLAEAAALACALMLAQPASAQVIDERFPFLEDRARRNRMWQQWGPQGPDQQKEQRAQTYAEPVRPPPATLKPGATSNVMVFGDQLAEWLAYGLEDAFADTPELGILRKMRPFTGLIRLETRWENYDWPQQAKEMLAAEKPDYVVMMIGLNDRRGIREVRPAPRNPAQKAATQQKAAAPAPQGQQPQATPAPPDKEKSDAEAPPQDTAQNDDAPAPEPTLPAGGVVHEFRAERWGELYGKRIDEMIAALKSRGVPVLWVGLPSIRGARPSTEMVYLNDLFRARAEKAGITYVDIWDGFVDEGSNFNQFGPDFEGQTRRLRTFDGVNFTRPGARKLAHYVEREIRRVMQTRISPMVTIPKEEPEEEVVKAPPGQQSPQQPVKPVASPVMSLTAPTQGGETLLGGAPGPGSAADSVAARVLVRGEAVEAPAGRADDFVWPRRDVITASGALPPDPVLPAPVQAIVNPAAVPVAPRPPLAAMPNARWQQQQAQRERPQDHGWFSWGNPQPQPRDPRQQRTNRWDNQPSFFGGWFGR